MALGKNLLVAFMSWEGYNFEDAIILSSRLVRTTSSPRSTSRSTRSTPARPSWATRRSRATSRTAPRSRCATSTTGASCASARVGSGDLLVGKVTPKGETELTAEEKLIRAIFKEKAREVRDTSLKVPHGEGGVVIDVMTFLARQRRRPAAGRQRSGSRLRREEAQDLRGRQARGRHGNKGVISRIVDEQDMPFLETAPSST